MQEYVIPQELEIVNGAWSQHNDSEPLKTYSRNKCVQLNSSVLGPTGQQKIFWINFYAENVY